ncbi:AAA family ATPase [Aliarcobacter butzleri]|uniref:AAA family ATPase n=1 Tax=Aliarcobacter butzleri TaxID=28197 RepID=UPI0021B21195|nr:ATP-binding protein [Aliarcobacter butzleri]MCT7536519.1 ATP-binding protein [Aliarcobacter butzleri]MCT7623285.1 ATP-binding protein [Aliarcobacter butzleri]
MIKLKKVEIHKYKSIEKTQIFNVDDKITTLVGMNESGKTSILEALAKVNYFTDDNSFSFNITHDYPRREVKKLKKADDDPEAVTCYYSLTEEFKKKVNSILGCEIFNVDEISYTKKYSNSGSYTGITVDNNKFLELKINYSNLDSSIIDKVKEIKSIDNITSLIEELKSDNEDQKFDNLIVELEQIKPFYENKWKWSGAINEYITRELIKPNLPKFLYYDEYYSLPSRISIEKLNQEKLDEEDLKTAKALFELAEINIDELIKSDDFEDFKAELEATEASITDELFKFWHSNNNLQIEFAIDKQIIKNPQNGSQSISEHVLDIRVKNLDKRVSLPLNKRSKGFNWFFSFFVWFKKIQEDAEHQYILLLDEPGLNLHAMAQENLLNFFEELSKDYQIIYTTHSPFMIDSNHLERVNTVFETKDGSVISDSLQEKDPNTLFPLQAALGYSIAQNLFINKNNLLVEGISDLIYLNHMSSLLESIGKSGLDDNINIVPVGGLDKVSAFISLMRGSNLNLVCLLDTFTDQKSKANIDNLISGKILKEKNLKFFHEFVDIEIANIEDIFTREEYLKLFNEAFTEYEDISIDNIDKSKTIINEINRIIDKKRFNHFRPANLLLSKGYSVKDFDSLTLERFEKIFIEINKLILK